MWQDGRLDPTGQETFPGPVLWPEPQPLALGKSCACRGWGWVFLGLACWGEGGKPCCRESCGSVSGGESLWGVTAAAFLLR